MHKAPEYRGTKGSYPGGLGSPPCTPLSSQEGCEGHPEEGRDTTLRRKGQMGEEVNLARHSLYVKHSQNWNTQSHTYSSVHPDWKPSPNPHFNPTDSKFMNQTEVSFLLTPQGSLWDRQA